MYYRGAKAAVVCCSCSSVESFDRAESWLDDLHQFAEPDCVVSLAANKSDLLTDGADDGNGTNKTASFNRAAIENLAKKFNVPVYFTSAHTGENVESLFMDLVTRAIEHDDAGMAAAKAAVGGNGGSTEETNEVIRLEERDGEDVSNGGGCC
jgi:GTPase SAR1 family protein